MTEIEQNFKFAVDQIKSSNSTKTVSDDLKLRFYALYKQATIGKCNTPKPWAVQVVERAKWDAWNTLGTMTKETAMVKYCELYIENS